MTITDIIITDIINELQEEHAHFESWVLRDTAHSSEAIAKGDHYMGSYYAGRRDAYNSALKSIERLQAWAQQIAQDES